MNDAVGTDVYCDLARQESWPGADVQHTLSTRGARVKAKQVLEVLLLERGRVVPKCIAELLWAEDLPKRLAATIEM